MNRFYRRCLLSLAAIGLFAMPGTTHALVLDDFSSAGLELSNDPANLHNVLTINGFIAGKPSSTVYAMAPPPTFELNAQTQATFGPSTTGESGRVLNWAQGNVKLSSIMTFAPGLPMSSLTDGGVNNVLRLSMAWTNELAATPIGMQKGEVKFTLGVAGAGGPANVVVPVTYDGNPGVHHFDVPLASFFPGAIATNECDVIGFEFASSVPEGQFRFVSFGTVPEPGTIALGAGALGVGIALYRRRIMRRRGR